MAIDAPAFQDIGFGEGAAHIALTAGQAAAFMRSERDDSLAVKVDVLEQGEHHLGVGAPTTLDHR